MKRKGMELGKKIVSMVLAFAMTVTAMPAQTIFAADDTTTAPFYVADSLVYDQSKNTDVSGADDLGLESIAVEEITVFDATSSTDQFCNGVVMIKFKDKIYCQWQSSDGVEDEQGTRVVYSKSTDGSQGSWTSPEELVDFDAVKQVLTNNGISYNENNTVNTDSKAYCSSGGWFVNKNGTPEDSSDDELIAYINVWTGLDKRGGYTFYKASSDGTTWSEPKPVTMYDGSILNGIFEQDPHVLANGRIVNAAHFQTNSSGGLVVNPIYTDSTDGVSGWKKAGYKNFSLENDGTSTEMEPSLFVNSDNNPVMIFRDQGSVVGTNYKVLASISYDNGATWTQPVRTNMPEARQKQSAGNLPDGSVYIVGCPVDQINDTTNNKVRRYPLAISLSANGKVFDKAFVIGKGADVKTAEFITDTTKSKGYHYPKSVIIDDYLYVSYAESKENAQFIRIPIASISQSAFENSEWRALGKQVTDEHFNPDTPTYYMAEEMTASNENGYIIARRGLANADDDIYTLSVNMNDSSYGLTLVTAKGDANIEDDNGVKGIDTNGDGVDDYWRGKLERTDITAVNTWYIDGENEGQIYAKDASSNKYYLCVDDSQGIKINGTTTKWNFKWPDVKVYNKHIYTTTEGNVDLYLCKDKKDDALFTLTSSTSGSAHALAVYTIKTYDTYAKLDGTFEYNIEAGVDELCLQEIKYNAKVLYLVGEDETVDNAVKEISLTDSSVECVWENGVELDTYTPGTYRLIVKYNGVEVGVITVNVTGNEWKKVSSATYTLATSYEADKPYLIGNWYQAITDDFRNHILMTNDGNSVVTSSFSGYVFPSTNTDGVITADFECVSADNIWKIDDSGRIYNCTNGTDKYYLELNGTTLSLNSAECKTSWEFKRYKENSDSDYNVLFFVTENVETTTYLYGSESGYSGHTKDGNGRATLWARSGSDVYAYLTGKTAYTINEGTTDDFEAAIAEETKLYVKELSEDGTPYIGEKSFDENITYEWSQYLDIYTARISYNGVYLGDVTVKTVNEELEALNWIDVTPEYNNQYVRVQSMEKNSRWWYIITDEDTSINATATTDVKALHATGNKKDYYSHAKKVKIIDSGTTTIVNDKSKEVYYITDLSQDETTELEQVSVNKKWYADDLGIYSIPDGNNAYLSAWNSRYDGVSDAGAIKPQHNKTQGATWQVESESKDLIRIYDSTYSEYMYYDDGKNVFRTDVITEENLVTANLMLYQKVAEAYTEVAMDGTTSYSIKNRDTHVTQAYILDNLDFYKRDVSADSNVTITELDASELTYVWKKADGTVLAGEPDTSVAGTYVMVAYYEDVELGSVTVVTEFDPYYKVEEAEELPQYPNEGATRVDKTATNSEYDWYKTGTTKVELDVAGISAKSIIDVVLVVDISNSMGRYYKLTDADGNPVYLTKDGYYETDANGYTTYNVGSGEIAYDDEGKSTQADDKNRPGEKLDEAMDAASEMANIILGDNEDGNVNNNTVTFVTFGGYDEGHNETANKYFDATQTVFAYQDSYDVANTIFQSTKFLSYGDKAIVQIGSTGTQEAETRINSGGTNYDYAFAQAQLAVSDIKTAYANANNGASYDDSGRKTIVLFMTDGAPTYYNDEAVNGSGGNYKWGTATKYNENLSYQSEPKKENYTTDGVFDEDGYNEAYAIAKESWYSVSDAWLNSYVNLANKYASSLYEMVDGFYSVGFKMSEDLGISKHCYNWTLENFKSVLAGVASNSEDVDVLLAENVSELTETYTQIANQLVYSGNYAKVYDELAEEYTLLTDKYIEDVNGTTLTKVVDGNTVSIENLIEYKIYDLYTQTDVDAGTTNADMIGKRNGNSTTIEKVWFDVNSTSNEIEAFSNLIYTGSSEEPTYTNILSVTRDASGNITYMHLDAQNFEYINDKGYEYFNWAIGGIADVEYALSYNAHLEGTTKDEGLWRQTNIYPTNKTATLDYIDINGDHAHRTFPVPELSWGEAMTTIEYYLVNSEGKPVNKYGIEVPFENRVRIELENGSNYSFGVPWNSGETTITGKNYVPVGYALYNENASYTLTVGEEGLGTLVVTDTGKDVVTTKWLDDPGTTVATYDVSSTHVAFAVVATTKIEATPLGRDRVVVDYGKPIEIAVFANNPKLNLADDATSYKAEVIGFRPYLPDESYVKYVQSGEGYSTLSGAYGDFSIVNKKTGIVKYTPDSIINGVDKVFTVVKITPPVPENEYDYWYLYQELDIIPATNVYYETDFVSYATPNEGSNIKSNGVFNLTKSTAYTSENTQWEEKSDTNINANYTGELDDNKQDDGTVGKNQTYGYDSSYTDDAYLSDGSGIYVEGEGKEKTKASFTFTGTGFDIISVTGKSQGMIRVTAYYANTNTIAKRMSVLNRHESEMGDYYQIPVISMELDAHGTYDVVIDVYESYTYNAPFEYLSRDNDFYFDAVRIYDPVDVTSSTYYAFENPKGYVSGTTTDETSGTTTNTYLAMANETNGIVALNAYIEDGEAYEDITEVRDILIDENSNFEIGGSGLGVLFIERYNNATGGGNESTVTGTPITLPGTSENSVASVNGNTVTFNSTGTSPYEVGNPYTNASELTGATISMLVTPQKDYSPNMATSWWDGTPILTFYNTEDCESVQFTLEGAKQYFASKVESYTNENVAPDTKSLLYYQVSNDYKLYANTPYLITYVIENDELSCYVNGKKIRNEWSGWQDSTGYRTVLEMLSDSDTKMYIGGATTGTTMGWFDNVHSLPEGTTVSDVIYYDKALTEEEISSMSVEGTGHNYNLAKYEAIGPNNETYLSEGQAIVFAIENIDVNNIASIDVGAKAITGDSVTLKATIASSTSAAKNSSVTIEKEIGSSTSQYYTLYKNDGAAVIDDSDGDGIGTAYVYITNANTYTGSNDETDHNVLSITDIKVAYKSESAVTQQYSLVAAYSLLSFANTCSVLEPSYEIYDAQFTSDQCKIFGNAQMLVETTEYVEALEVTDRFGRPVEADISYVDNVSGNKVWSITIIMTKLGEQVYKVTGYGASGTAGNTVQLSIKVTTTEEGGWQNAKNIYKTLFNCRILSIKRSNGSKLFGINK